MRIIGLTGGIGCGKSSVSLVLSSLGAAIIDGDKISHGLTQPGGKALPQIRCVFGDDVFNDNGTLNRKKLGSIVFSSEKQRSALNGIIHPLVIDETKSRIASEEASGTEVCVLDMPLLFEAHMDSLCDTCWCVVLPMEMQIKRIIGRDGISEKEAMARISSQMSCSEKAKKCQIVIDNSGSPEHTSDIVKALYKAELQNASAKRDNCSK